MTFDGLPEVVVSMGTGHDSSDRAESIRVIPARQVLVLYL